MHTLQNLPSVIRLLLTLLTLTCAHAEPLVLTQAQFILSNAAAPPADSANWQNLTLPDNWNLSRPGVGGFGWYRVKFQLEHPAQRTWAIYAPKLSMNAAFYVNGALLRSGGSFEEPVARHWNRPLFFAIPPSLLRAGDNTLQVRLWTYPNTRGGLGELHLDEEALLHPQYERRYFVQTILPQLCNIVVAALGLFTLALWARHRSEPLYIIFCVFAVLWAIRSTHTFVRDIPVSAFYWDIWVQSSFGWCALIFVLLAMRISGMRSRWIEGLLLAYAVAGPIVMYLAGPQHMHRVANNWSFVIVPVAIVFEGFLIREAWRRRTLVSAVLAAVWGVIIAASVHDGLVHRDKLAFDSFYLVSYAMVPLSLAIGWILINRFTRALRESEQLNLELEQRVAQKHAELSQNFERLQEMERRTAVAEERRRLMSEMHDGIGSQLIGTLEMIEHGAGNKGDIANELRECLDNLRLTIDSLEPSENDLLSVLANLRYRLEGRLKRLGIALDWQVRDVPPLASLTPQNVLHVLRILQEAFTNILKHAQAKTITVQTVLEDQYVVISVRDDGRGFPAQAEQRQGRGLIGMRRRAQALGAMLNVAPSANGTTLTLSLPHS